MNDAPILSPMNQIADIDSASDFEKKHTPFVSVQAEGDLVKISVSVGHYVPHPNQPDHFIQWIEVQADGNTIARFDLSPVATEPQVSVSARLSAGTSIRAIEYCNLHGLWAADLNI